MFVTLSLSILTTTARRFSSQTEKQGISKRFVDYFHSIDSTLGQKALGPDQTISGKVQSSVSDGISQARSFNEQKGVTKRVGDVSALLPLFVSMRYIDDRGVVLYACVEHFIRFKGADVLHDDHETHPRHPRGGEEACGVE